MLVNAGTNNTPPITAVLMRPCTTHVSDSNPMPDLAFDPHSVEDMTAEPERWHETVWPSLLTRLTHITKEQWMQLAKETR